MELSNTIPIITNEDFTLSVDARELHKALGVGKDFSTWIKDRIEKYGFSEGKDFSPNLGKTSSSLGGRPSIEYKLSIPMAKELAMVENNDLGRSIRLKLIKIEEHWNQEDIVIARAMQMTHRRLKSTEAELEKQKELVKTLEPKAQEWDRFLNSEGLIGFQEAAAVLSVKGMGRTNLFGFATQNGLLIDSRTPYREHIEKGRVVVRSGSYFNPKTNKMEPCSTVYLTAKGLEYLAKKLESSGYKINSTWNKEQMLQMVGT